MTAKLAVTTTPISFQSNRLHTQHLQKFPEVLQYIQHDVQWFSFRLSIQQLTVTTWITSESIVVRIYKWVKH